MEAQEPDERRELQRRGTTHQPEPENPMPQPLGIEQAILFRKIAFWQEKIAVLNRFNHIGVKNGLGHWTSSNPLNCCKYLIRFRHRD